MHAPGQIKQDCRQIHGVHGIKDVPLGLGNRNHHAVVGAADFQGQIVPNFRTKIEGFYFRKMAVI